MNIFWKRVKSRIREFNTTQEWVANKIGVSLNTFKGWIVHDRLPRVDLAVAIAKALETTVEWLLEGEEGEAYLQNLFKEKGSLWRPPQKYAHIHNTLTRLSDYHVEVLTKLSSFLLETEIRMPKPKTENDEPILSIPFFGKVAAGKPIDIASDPGVYIQLPARMIPFGNNLENYFAVQAVGTSMTDIIPNGAIVLIRAQKHADPGDIILVRYENESTIKKLCLTPTGYCLEYMDGTGRRIEIKDGNWEIQGKFICVIKE